MTVLYSPVLLVLVFMEALCSIFVGLKSTFEVTGDI